VILDLLLLNAWGKRSEREALARDVLGRARAKGLMIVTAESCTGGLVSAALTEIAGSSDVFDRGFVTYSNGAKTGQLGVDPGLISQHGAVSEPVAAAMAEGALARSDAGLAVSITGIAGPGGGTTEKPVGLVCFGIARRGGATVAETKRFGPRSRRYVRAEAAMHALRLLRV
jgi:nicotinamide-nucleotide amidase